MELRSVGSLEVSVVGLGCNNFGRLLEYEDSLRVVEAALEAGINHFDTAENYGEGASEEQLGRALGARRADVVVTTKFGAFPGEDGLPTGSAAAIRRTCEASLRRLGSDYIDLYLMHYPDPSTPVAETLAALQALKDEGKVREFGCSNLTADQLIAARAAADDLGIDGFVALQSSYSLLDRTPEPTILPLCESHGLAFLPYFPLASGMLTGKYRRGAGPPSDSRLATAVYGSRYPGLRTEASYDLVESLEAFASERGHTLLELAFGWLASNSLVTSIAAGATKPEQVHGNAAAAEAWRLTRDEMARVQELTEETVEVSYTLHARSPEYTKAPAGVADLR